MPDCFQSCFISAFKFNLRRYDTEFGDAEQVDVVVGRGLHSFTFPLDLSAVCRIGGACRCCLGAVRGYQGVSRVC
jgi:hypothetical protein